MCQDRDAMSIDDMYLRDAVAVRNAGRHAGIQHRGRVHIRLRNGLQPGVEEVPGYPDLMQRALCNSSADGPRKKRASCCNLPPTVFDQRGKPTLRQDNAPYEQLALEVAERLPLVEGRDRTSRRAGTSPAAPHERRSTRTASHSHSGMRISTLVQGCGCARFQAGGVSVGVKQVV